MNQFSRFFLGIFTVSLLTCLSSQAKIRVAAVGMLGKTEIHSKTSHASSDGYGMGGGAIAEVGLPFGSSGIELGILYHHKKTRATFAVPYFGYGSVKTDYTTIQVPLLFRYWFGSIFSLGAGGYYTRFTKISSVVTLGNTNFPYTSTVPKSDYGLTGSAALVIPMGLVTGLLFDVRYNYGLKKDSVRDAQGLVGLNFML